MEKLTHVMEWRQQVGAPDLINMVALANKSSQPPDDADADLLQRWKLAQGMVDSLNKASMYWHGLTKDGHPILWIRTSRKPWYPNVQSEINALIVMADVGILQMPKGVTDFVVISHSYKPPPPNPKFAFQMLKGLVKGYPDRLHFLISAPVSSIVEFCMNLLLPLMPGRLAHKFMFFSLEHVQEKLQGLLLNGADDIPTFFGGPVDHDSLYPEEKNCPKRGEGSLSFDFYGMVERMKKQKELFEAQQETQTQNQVI